MPHFIVVDVRGRSKAAGISRLDHDDDERAVAAAAILAKKRVPICVVVNVMSDSQVIVRSAPDASLSHLVISEAIAAAIYDCSRQITSADVDRYLSPPPRASRLPDLFGASA